ncbi:MAG: endopeptidase La, partial [Clostridia bacterium]|nr:endopeptidase La [Clostridia bacterium]
KTQLKMSDKTLTALIDSYTRESGVRTLERTIGQVCRKAVVRMSEDATIETITLKPADLKEYLGAPKFLRQEVEKKGVVGVVNGLAWTSVGGEVMPVEAVTFDGGHDKVEITGNLGNVMKESASLAKSAARARLSAYGVDADFFEKHDLHIHVPEGATPKDGPSAGVALTCAVMSAVTGIPADNTIAMTGEITLHGKVLPIGGVKEKLLAAYRLGIRKILLPKENVADLEKIDAAILEKMEITPIGDVNEALKIVLLRDEVSK